MCFDVWLEAPALASLFWPEEVDHEPLLHDEIMNLLLLAL